MGNYVHFTCRKLLLYLLPASAACVSIPLAVESLQPRISNGQIRVAAPQFHFVAGKALERLHNGSPVPFAVQLALSTDRWTTIAERDIERFVVSYDLWEEKFSISKLGSPRKSVSHLSMQTAEAWCVEEMALAPASAAGDQPFWLRLEVRAENPGEDLQVLTGEGVSLTRLVELFSRRARTEQNHWLVEAGPFHLASLTKSVLPGDRR